MAAAGRRGKRERRPRWAEVACGGRPMVAAGSGARRGGAVGRGERARGGGRLVGVVGVARDLFIGWEGKEREEGAVVAAGGGRRARGRRLMAVGLAWPLAGHPLARRCGAEVMARGQVGRGAAQVGLAGFVPPWLARAGASTEVGKGHGGAGGDGTG
jgi:hypothetical protein